MCLKACSQLYRVEGIGCCLMRPTTYVSLQSVVNGDLNVVVDYRCVWESCCCFFCVICCVGADFLSWTSSNVPPDKTSTKLDASHPGRTGSLPCRFYASLLWSTMFLSCQFVRPENYQHDIFENYQTTLAKLTAVMHSGTEMKASDFGVKRSKVQGHGGIKLAGNNTLHTRTVGLLARCLESKTEFLVTLYIICRLKRWLPKLSDICTKRKKIHWKNAWTHGIDLILHFPALQFGPSFSRSCV